ncbi:MAG: transcriptional repressor [Alphaproteobacteria bacterium]|nr:transcriptional repressor [Alphaproteobacteria bacterium]
METQDILKNEISSFAKVKEGLSRNEHLVLSSLKSAKTTLTAYELLDILRDRGFRAPTVYRALNGLRKRGLTHRLERTRSFVACNEKHVHQDDIHPIFAMCNSCGSVLELVDSKLMNQLSRTVEQLGFTVSDSVVELHGSCMPCREKK